MNTCYRSQIDTDTDRKAEAIQERIEEFRQAKKNGEELDFDSPWVDLDAADAGVKESDFY